MKTYEEMAARVLARRDQAAAEKKRLRRRCKQCVSVAACCGLAVLLGVGLAKDGPVGGPEDTALAGQNRLEISREEPEENGQDGGQNVQKPEELPAETAEGSYADGNSAARAPETAAVFGGCYLDDHGAFVVVLTVDTPETRRAVCQALGVAEVSAVFVPGDYSLAYLTQVQERIGLAMQRGDLPFVTASGVYEPLNRIKVSVTTEKQEDLEKLRALDPLGGALVIEEAGERAMEEVAEAGA